MVDAVDNLLLLFLLEGDKIIRWRWVESRINWKYDILNIIIIIILLLLIKYWLLLLLSNIKITPIADVWNLMSSIIADYWGIFSKLGLVTEWNIMNSLTSLVKRLMISVTKFEPGKH
jgi:hypothetical protein